MSQLRKQNLYGIQDWKSIYQTFRDADFKSYDYETLRKSMVDYLRIYNPENFNDYITSSEYVALIDLIAFMGQSLSFRMDLNARENFLETSRRRDNTLRLANMISYVPKRNIAASGFLKIEAIRTTEAVLDSLGNNLANASIDWNSDANENWLDQWNTILNAALVDTQQVGRPGQTINLEGIQNSQYTVNLPATSAAPFQFTSLVDNNTLDFEIINPTLKSGVTIEESSPDTSGAFNLIYRDNFQGLASNNTGYFLFFKQGTLTNEIFTVTESLPNRRINLGAGGINNQDLWVFQVNTDQTTSQWTAVDAVNGENLSYNTLDNSLNKKFFSAESRAGDFVTLNFGDGVFSEIPVGDFLVYYRQSNGLSYSINPGEMESIIINIPYQSKTGREQQLTVVASLKYTVANSTPRETLDDIKLKAPQNFYVQNRMVNGQDYNSFPFVRFNNVLKLKSVNRVSSGVSRYLDVIDNTGRYSSTNIVCDDGYLYSSDQNVTANFSFVTRDDVAQAVDGMVAAMIQSTELRDFFIANYAATTVTTPTIWNRVLNDNDASSGFLTNSGLLLEDVANNTLVTTTDNRFENKFRVGAVLKFQAPAGKVFGYNNQLVNQTAQPQINQKTTVWATVKKISYFGRGDQTGNTPLTAGRDTNGVGAIILNERVPSGAILTQVLPTFSTTLSSTVISQLVESLFQQQSVALGYKAGVSNTDATGEWFIINNPVDGVFTEPTSLLPTQTTSWLLKFSSVNKNYTITQKSQRYFFGSEKQTRFFYDPDVKIYDPLSGKLLKDRIDVLKTNTLPVLNTSLGFGDDVEIAIANAVLESDGYLDDTQIQVTYADRDNDGSPDNPAFFSDIVGTPATAGDINSWVFFKKDPDSLNSYVKLALQAVKIENSLTTLNNNLYDYVNGDVIFLLDTKTFYEITRQNDVITKTPATSDTYLYRAGRQSLKFQYRHNAPSDRRIDPSPSNIIDVYVLLKQYSDDYQLWLQDITGRQSEPQAPTPESLRNSFSELENYRMISDLMIYSTAKFKPLFGSKADDSLRAKFLVVKNPNVIVSDSEIKSQVITKVNEFFLVDNWDFGETFYFSELAAYIHSELNTIISSIHLVPTSANQVYGDLQQIRCLPYEIFANAATVLDVEVVNNLTSVKLRSGN